MSDYAVELRFSGLEIQANTEGPLRGKLEFIAVPFLDYKEDVALDLQALGLLSKARIFLSLTDGKMFATHLR